MNCRYYQIVLLFVALLQMGGCATYESSPLIVSVRSEDVADVKKLINAGADVNLLSYDFINGQAWKITPLIRAALTGNTEIVGVLLKAGADVNRTDEWGDTALMGAAESNSPEVAQILIDAGADINATKPDLTTALMIAARKGYLDVVILLLDAGANADVGAGSGATALSLATQNGHTRVVEALNKTSQFLSPPSEDWERVELPNKGSSLPWTTIVSATQWRKPNGSTISLAFHKVKKPSEEWLKMEILKIMYEGRVEDVEKKICKNVKASTKQTRVDKPLMWGRRINELEGEMRCYGENSETIIMTLFSLTETKKHVYLVSLQTLKENFEADKTAYYQLVDSIKDVDKPVSSSKQSSQQIDKEARTYIKIISPDYVYEYDKVKYEVYPGEVLEVLKRERCRGGIGECWNVRHVKTGEIGYVFEDKARKRHFVYTGMEP